jgi:holo-[acyl-carrier protein] synthase
MQIGTDIVKISRIQKACQRERFKYRFFTPRELPPKQGFPGYYAHLAGKFAAKEAVAKALGTGFRGFKWRDIEILKDDLGKPYAILQGKALEILKAQGYDEVLVTISHCEDYAIAFAVTK